MSRSRISGCCCAWLLADTILDGKLFLLLNINLNTHTQHTHTQTTHTHTHKTPQKKTACKTIVWISVLIPTECVYIYIYITLSSSRVEKVDWILGLPPPPLLPPPAQASQTCDTCITRSDLAHTRRETSANYSGWTERGVIFLSFFCQNGYRSIYIWPG